MLHKINLISVVLIWKCTCILIRKYSISFYINHYEIANNTLDQLISKNRSFFHLLTTWRKGFSFVSKQRYKLIILNTFNCDLSKFRQKLSLSVQSTHKAHKEPSPDADVHCVRVYIVLCLQHYMPSWDWQISEYINIAFGERVPARGPSGFFARPQRLFFGLIEINHIRRKVCKVRFGAGKITGGIKWKQMRAPLKNKNRSSFSGICSRENLFGSAKEIYIFSSSRVCALFVRKKSGKSRAVIRNCKYFLWYPILRRGFCCVLTPPWAYLKIYNSIKLLCIFCWKFFKFISPRLY